MTAASAACLLGVVAVVGRGTVPAERRTLEFSGGIAAMVLAGSVAWWDDYSALLLVLLALAGLAAQRSIGRAPRVAGAALLLAAGVAAPAFLGLGGTGWLPGTYGSSWWFPALQLDSLPAYSALALLVVLLVALARSRQASPPPALAAPAR